MFCKQLNGKCQMSMRIIPAAGKTLSGLAGWWMLIWCMMANYIRKSKVVFYGRM